MKEYHNVRDGEKVVMIIRNHWYYFVKTIFQIVGLLIIAFVSLFIKDIYPYSWYFLLIALIFSAGLFYYNWFIWKNDLYILTDQRLVDINRNAIFSKHVTEISLDKIQNVSYKQTGFLPMTFKFGVVVIETAGEGQNIQMEMAPNPQAVQKQISDAFHQYRDKMGLVFEQSNNEKNNPTNHGGNQL